MSSDFSQIPPLTAELSTLERLKKMNYTSAFIFDWIFFILAGYKDNHTISIERYNGRIVFATVVPSFFIGSSSFLQVTRTGMKAWMSSNVGQNRPLTTELFTLELLKSWIIMFWVFRPLTTFDKMQINPEVFNT